MRSFQYVTFASPAVFARSRPSLLGAVLSLSCLLAANACGGPATATNQDTPTGSDAGVVIGEIMPGGGEPCTEPHTICVGVQIPSPLAGAPTLLRITAYKSIPPTTPPDGVAAMLPTPAVTAGQLAHLKLSDANLTGDYFIVGALYMPGGGSVIPVDGIDYAAFSSQPYLLDGKPMNMSETLVLSK